MVDKIANRDEYLIAGGEAEAEIKVKGSKFIAAIIPVRSKEEAEEKYAELKKRYYDATHNCFAYRIRKDIFRYSDDGEPSGTAGKPIFQVLESAELNEALCVVTRYFGGTKLGTGGLIRAYSEAAHQALASLKIEKKILTHTLKLNFGYDLENLVRKVLHEFKGEIGASDYAARIEMEVKIPKSRRDQFKAKLIDLSNSTIKIDADE
jgi:uncharacterized YigZ family protein